MPRYWSYKFLQEVVVNEKAAIDVPDKVGKQGSIVDLLHSAIYDYCVYFEEDKTIVKFKEEELNPIH